MYVNLSRGCISTDVGYLSPPGHNHDDNCTTMAAECSNGHTVSVSKRNECCDPDCDWKGKKKCFCHNDEKLDNWPVKE